MIEPPNGIDEIKRVYGDCKLTRGTAGWKVDKGWEYANCVTVADLPLVAPRKLYVHRLIVEPLREALTRCAGMAYPVRRIGCFAPRPKRVNGDPSTHSWAIAVDINPDTNPLGAPGSSLVTDFPDEWIAAWEDVGWRWGGRWVGPGRRPDAMHFQFCGGY